MDKKLVIDALAYRRSKAYGYQEYLFNLLDYFYKYRSDILYSEVIIVCDNSQKEDFEKYKDKMNIISFSTSNILKRNLVQQFLPFLLKLKSSDCVLFTANYSSVFHRAKYILVIHDLIYLRKGFLPNKMMRLQRHLFVPRSVKIADAIIAISEFTKQDIIKSFKLSPKQEEKIFKIYNYFNFEKFESTKDFSSKYNDSYFLCIASSAYHKNIITVIKAFRKFSEIDKHKKLFVVGKLNVQDDEYFKLLPEDVKSKIVFIKDISNEELGVLYKKSMAYISATFFEGLGMPIVEAMYFNTNVIISDLDVLREVTEGKALFFNPNDENDLVKKMFNFSKDLIFTKDIVEKKFSETETSKRYISVINNI